MRGGYRSGSRGRGWGLATWLVGFSLLGAAVSAQDSVPEAPPAVEDATPLTGRDIYQRVLDNQFETSYQEQRIFSRDPGGYEQELRFWTRFRDYRTGGEPDADGIISKSVLKFTHPFDKRESGYLFVERHRRANDGYHYSKAREKVMRVNTAKESIFGTDFTLEDIAIARQIDDASYERHPDETLQGVPVYVVEAFHKPEAEPQYSKSILYVDQVTFVPLRTRHWDHSGFEAKELTAPRERIQRFDGVWIPMESTMRDLAEETMSKLSIDRVDANVPLADRFFVPQRLARTK